MDWKELLRKLRGPNGLLALVALLAGWGAMATATRYLDGHAQELEKQAQLQYQPRPVVVASQDLRAGTALTPDLMSIRQMPSGYLPSGTIAGQSAGSLLGRHLSVALQKGDPLTDKVLTPRAPPSLAAMLPRGYRALTVAVDEVNSLSGMLIAGDRVDLYLSRGQGEGGARLALLMEKVQLLAAGDQVSGHAPAGQDFPGGDYSTVTLLVDAEQAARIILAQRTGSLSVALRPSGDDGKSQLLTHDSRRLLQVTPGVSRPAGGDDRVELLMGGYGGPAPRRELLTPGIASARHGDRS